MAKKGYTEDCGGMKPIPPVKEIKKSTTKKTTTATKKTVKRK